jgi:hypothetical protein
MFPNIGLPGDAGQAEDGIRHIGTNAIPFLLKWIRYDRPAWKTKLYALVHRTPRGLKLAYLVTDISQERRAFGSMRALLVLGPEAHGAVRELARVMYDPKASSSAGRALTVLDALVMKTSDRRVIPALKAMLDDPNPNVRAFAAHGLRNIDRQAPEKNDPVLK